MSLLKSGSVSSHVIVASSVYLCHSCGHTEIRSANETEDSSTEIKCLKCNSSMKLVSSSCNGIGDELDIEE